MYFDVTFEFPYDNSIRDIGKRIGNINRFLKNHVKLSSNHRHLGIEIFCPNFSVPCCRRKSVQRFAIRPEHRNHYLLGFFFFNDNLEEVGNTLLIDLGTELQQSIENDALAFSAISATQLQAVEFSLVGNSIRVNFKGDDTNRFISNHLTYVLNGKEIPD